MTTTRLGLTAMLGLLLSGPGCGPPPGANGAYTGSDAAVITIQSVELKGRGDRGTTERAVRDAARSVQCPKANGEATFFITIGGQGEVARLDLQESGGIRAGGCIIPQMRAALSGSAPAGARVVIRLRAD